MVKPSSSEINKIALQAARDGWKVSFLYALTVVVTRLPWVAIVLLVAAALGLVAPPLVGQLIAASR